MADDPCGIACHDATFGNVFRDDRPRAYHRLIADGDPWQDDRSGADPNVIADRDVSGDVDSISTGIWFYGVSDGKDHDFWAELAIIPDRDFACVKEDAVEIGEEVLADIDVGPVIAMEGWLDEDAFANPAKKSGKEFCSVGLVFFGGVVQFAKAAGIRLHFHEFFVAAEVFLSS